MFHEPHDLYCGVGHPLFKAPRKVIEKATLSEYPSVIRLYHHEFDRTKLGVVREKATVNSMEGMLSLLLSGGYIGYLPRHYARSWVKSDLLAPIQDEKLTYTSEHGIITQPGKHRSLALETFVSLVKDVSSRQHKAD